ncbi:MAG: radical SAM protein [Phascolarctobacterium sp.]|nr:radical SAM protein [Phascolarctobacterium sp.]
MTKIKMLVLSLTGKCNFACRYCYAAEHDKSKMSTEIALAAVDLAAASGEKFVIQFSGGEPLLNYTALQKVVEHVEEHKLPAVLQLQTNGSLITDEIAQFLFRHKVAIGVSLDGRPNVNDKLRLKKNGYGATGAILKGIEVLRRNNVACGVTCVVTEDNVEQISGIVEFAYFLGNVRKIGFDILRGQGRGAGLRPPTPEAMEQAMRSVYARRDALQRLTGMPMQIAQQERVKVLCRDCSHAFGHCYAMNGEAAFVDAKGDIYACSSLVGNQEFYIGNVMSGIEEQLVDKTKRQISETMDFCRQCPDFKLCGGGCFARYYGMENKDDYGAECAMKRVSIDQVV